MKCYVILLAGGSGTRMKSDTPKQFMEVAGKQLIRYPLDVLEKSDLVDGCVLVAAKRHLKYMEEQILVPGKYRKVRALAAGGGERYESVLNGLKKLRGTQGEIDPEDIVMVHDGARPFLTEELIRTCRDEAIKNRACVAAVPAKDTIAIEDGRGFEDFVPLRKKVWVVQTPQAFQAAELFRAFEKLEGELREENGRDKLSWVTDDAAVVEHYNGTKIRLAQGDYRNIKVTTPEDIAIAEGILKEGKTGG